MADHDLALVTGAAVWAASSPSGCAPRTTIAQSGSEPASATDEYPMTVADRRKD